MKVAVFDSPFDAVFIEKFSKDDTPLFESQVILANEIRANQKTGFKDKKDLTVRSAISQIFTGERNLSRALKHALFLVIESRFDKENYDYRKFEKSLVEKFREAYEKRMEDKKERSPDRDYTTLIEATKGGKEFLITTLEPAELHKSELANRLKNELLEKTGIVTKPPGVEPATYKFYLPNTEGGRIAREFWEALRKHAIDEYELEPKIVDKRLTQANANKVILTYLAPMRIAMHPYVFINYSHPRKVTGFCVSYRHNEIPSVAELSLKVVYAWFHEYQKQLDRIEKEKDKNREFKNNFLFEPK